MHRGSCVEQCSWMLKQISKQTLHPTQIRHFPLRLESTRGDTETSVLLQLSFNPSSWGPMS